LVVVVELSSGRFHEVLRHVPAPEESTPTAHYHGHWVKLSGGRIKLPRVSLPLANISQHMASFPGGDVTIGSDEIIDAPPHRRRVPPFWIDRQEVSIRQYSDIGLFSVPAEIEDEPVEHAVRFVSYDEALSCAEASGKRLPAEAEYEFAATNGGMQKYPWGDTFPSLPEWPFGPVEVSSFDQTAARPPILGLYSNVAEWTSTWMQFYPAFKLTGFPPPYEPRDHRVVRGAPQAVIDDDGSQEGWETGPRQRVMCARTARKATVGFRMARSAAPRLKASDFEEVRETTR
jgi:formylglycine-generating enzyme required for sulfatase activity